VLRNQLESVYRANPMCVCLCVERERLERGGAPRLLYACVCVDIDMCIFGYSCSPVRKSLFLIQL